MRIIPERAFVACVQAIVAILHGSTAVRDYLEREFAAESQRPLPAFPPRFHPDQHAGLLTMLELGDRPVLLAGTGLFLGRPRTGRSALPAQAAALRSRP
jgi:glyoxylate carboligase